MMQPLAGGIFWTLEVVGIVGPGGARRAVEIHDHVGHDGPAAAQVMKRLMPSCSARRELRAPSPPSRRTRARPARSSASRPEPIITGGPPSAAGHQRARARRRCALALHSRRMTSSDSPRRLKRPAKSRPSASKSAAVEPAPTPRRKPAAGDEVRGEHALGELHGVAQRDLEHAGAELDRARHRAGHGERGERIGQREPAADRVERPGAGGSRSPRSDGRRRPGSTVSGNRWTLRAARCRSVWWWQSQACTGQSTLWRHELRDLPPHAVAVGRGRRRRSSRAASRWRRPPRRSASATSGSPSITSRPTAISRGRLQLATYIAAKTTRAARGHRRHRGPAPPPARDRRGDRDARPARRRAASTSGLGAATSTTSSSGFGLELEQQPRALGGSRSTSS